MIELLELLQLFGIAYATMAFIKFMVCVPQLPIAIATMSRLSTGEKGKIRLLYVFVVPIVIALVALFTWPAMMVKESLRFFIGYSDYAVMHDCVTAYREVHAE